MKKVGIVTIDGDFNYGNRLQNYALEQSVKSLGFDVETLIFPNRKNLRDYARELKKSLNKDYRTQMNSFKLMTELKEKAFGPFRKNYLNSIKHSRDEDFTNFDRFITGSDQVWNPSWRLIDDYWLRFAPRNKRFSYAASMATTIIHKANSETLPQYLQEMNEISVRESESVPFIEKISGRKAKLVIDPTMLLKKEDYERLIDEQRETQVDLSKPYILIYALEGLPEELRIQVENLAAENNWSIITIMGNKFHEEHKVYNPIEFVESIKNSQLVVSDSFHCGVFSILMESPFVLFNRTDGAQMSSRITTLLSRFDLMNHFYQDEDIRKLLNIDYPAIRQKLELARNEGLDYLRFILNKPI